MNGYNMTTNLVFSDPNIYQVVKIEIRKGLIDQSDNQGSSACTYCSENGNELMLTDTIPLYAETPTYVDAIEKAIAHEIGHRVFNIGDHYRKKGIPEYVQLPSKVKSIMNEAFQTPTQAQQMDLEHVIYSINFLNGRPFHYTTHPFILEKYYPNWRNMGR